MRKFFLLLLLALLAVPNVFAGTLTVRADNTGNYTSIAAAINAAQTGDEVVIADSAVYAESAQAAPVAGVTGVTVKAATGQTPTWDFTSQGIASPAFTILDGTGWVIEGIKFVYNGAQAQDNSPWTCAIRTAGNCPMITHCSFLGTMGTAIYYSEAGAANAGVDVSYCSFFLRDPDTSVTKDCYAIFWGNWISGTVEIDHCTFGCDGAAGGGGRILLWDNSVHNTIAISNTIFFGNELGYGCFDFAGMSNMSFEYVVSSVSTHNPGWLGAPVDLGHNQAPVADSMVNDPVHGDFSLKTGSPALGAAKDGTNIGAWQGEEQIPTDGVTLTVRADGTGDYTSIVTAINAAKSNDTVLIADNAVYAETAQAAPAAAVTGVIVKAAVGKTPTWDFTALGVNAPALTILDGTGWVIDGIKFLYNGPQSTDNSVWTCAIRTAGNLPLIKYCTFYGTMGAAIYFSEDGAANAGVDVSYCSFFLRDLDGTVTVDSYAIFWGKWITGTVEIDHCTIGCDGVTGGGNRTLLWDNGVHNTVAISNTIFFGNELGYWCADFTGMSNMSFEYIISSASAHNPGWLGSPTDLGNNQAPILDSMVNDPVNGDFSLKTGSPALGAAKDGTNIGSWQGAPVVNAAHGWSLFE